VIYLSLASMVLGLLVGSFLNVVIWRVPRGESVVRPPSHCPTCNAPVRPRDNIPVLSWLLLRGRCRDCSTPISGRYPLVEVATGAVFVVLAMRIGLEPELPAFLYLGAIGVALWMIDLDVKRLPDAIVLPSYLVAGVLLLLAAVLDQDWSALFRAVLGMAILFAFYFLLAFIYPAGMGFGDVKLAGVLGLYLGWLGWAELVTGGFLGFLYGGVVGLGLMLVRRAGRKSQIPFGPFMLAGALTAILCGGALADLYLDSVVG
jgi:leader peptidase (prepilin peptidase) / N-methyltransferase